MIFGTGEKLVKELIRMGIRDEKVLLALKEVKREEFIPGKLRPFAYENVPLAIGREQTISQPYMVALMSELLNVRPGQKVLEIGTGSGYQAAVLEFLGAEVFTLERILPLYQDVLERFKRLSIRAKVFWRDGEEGLLEEAPFDRVIVTAACEHSPAKLEEQLNQRDGILLFPLGPEEGTQQLIQVRYQAGKREEKSGIYCRFVPLKKGLTDS